MDGISGLADKEIIFNPFCFLPAGREPFFCQLFASGSRQNKTLLGIYEYVDR